LAIRRIDTESSPSESARTIAVLGTVSVVVCRTEVRERLPADVPAEGSEAISSSLGAALAVADHLPTAAARSLTSSAREAFVSGMAATGLTGAVLLLALGVGLLLLLRQK
jgi:DHA2 family multidrug resistance protein-like MFS transporter